MRSVKIPKIRTPKVTGRHSSTGRAKRTSEPRYRGGHRGTPAAPAVRPAEPRSAPAATARRPVLGQRLTPLSDRPNDVRPSPRSRFAGADTVPARIDYERRQRDEIRAQRAAGGGKVDARLAGAKTKAMGQRRPARSRFTGEATSEELNRTARKLHPAAPTVRGTAQRRPSEVRDPHLDPKADEGHKGQHRARKAAPKKLTGRQTATGAKETGKHGTATGQPIVGAGKPGPGIANRSRGFGHKVDQPDPGTASGPRESAGWEHWFWKQTGRMRGE